MGSRLRRSTLRRCTLRNLHSVEGLYGLKDSMQLFAQVHFAVLNPDMVSMLGESWSHGAEVSLVRPCLCQDLDVSVCLNIS